MYLKNIRITAKQAVVRGNLLKVSIHARSHNTTYGIVNKRDTINVTLTGEIQA